MSISVLGCAGANQLRPVRFYLVPIRIELSRMWSQTPPLSVDAVQ